jgi:hypothetical protein
LIAIITITAVVVVAVVGYLGGGLVYGQAQLNSARTSYNTVVDHQNSLFDALNQLSSLTSTDVSGSPTAASLQAAKKQVSDVVTKAQTAQPQIETDDGVLAQAQTNLQANQWLTVLSKSGINSALTRISHERKALGVARTITADYVEIGAFDAALYDSIIDLSNAETAANNKDFAGTRSDLEQMKTDIAKAISLDKAPGVPREVDGYLKDLQKLDNDFLTLFSDSASGDTKGADAADAAVNADLTKLDSDDISKVESEINAFYQPLIDSYNSEVAAANRG